MLYCTCRPRCINTKIGISCIIPLKNNRCDAASSHIPSIQRANPAPTHACVDPTRHPRSQEGQVKKQDENMDP